MMAARLDALVGRLPSTPRICELNARGAESVTALAAARHNTALYDGIIFAASNDSSANGSRLRWLSRSTPGPGWRRDPPWMTPYLTDKLAHLLQTSREKKFCDALVFNADHATPMGRRSLLLGLYGLHSAF